ncbi:MAG TPA: endonuclease III [Rhodothermales bacterium]|nr:endonuclease III [Rhodothermales bacterium]
MNRRERAQYTIRVLREVIPRPQSELHFKNEYELLVAVVLSAQCTDARVNVVTPAFFEAYPTLRSLAAAEPEDVYPIIKSISYPNQKAKHLVNAARKIVSEFGGRIPDTHDELVSLPGVGRKTAQVMLAVAFDKAALAVDTHVFRVANRIGITEDANTPYKVEQQLKEVIPQDEWGEAHHLLILHGRYTCTARNPKHDKCPVQPVCQYYQRLQAIPAPRKGLDPEKGAYYCKSRRHYFDEPDTRTDEYGVEQIACPRCGSTNVFETKTGKSTKRVPDYRI